MGERMAGKVALITGAARGQGRSHALRLAEEGADVILLDACKQLETVPFPLSTPEDLRETVDQVKAIGRRVLAAEVDIRDLDALTAAVTDGIEQLGRLDIVCGNAGIGSYGLGWELTPQAWAEMISVNLTGTWNTTRATIPALLAQGEGGSIILTSSSAAIHSIPYGPTTRPPSAASSGLPKAWPRNWALTGFGQHRASDRRQHAHDPQRLHISALPSGCGVAEQ